jgi:FkbM family methyltransferase
MIGALLRKLARRAGYDLRMDFPTLLENPAARLSIDPHWLVTLLAAARPRATFVQIGANDGVHDDPIRRHVLAHGWRGVLVEPDPIHFARLQSNYAGQSNRTRVNAAVGSGRSMTFYYIDPAAADLPGWTRGIGSLIEENVRKHAAECPAITPHIRSRPIPTLTVNEIFERLGTPEIDLVVTDIEGYDAEIIRQIDFTRWRPRCLFYESCHLARADHDALLSLLVKQGYLIAPGGVDSAAVLPGFAEAVPQAGDVMTNL